MNKNVAAELPVEVRRWLEQHASDATLTRIAGDVAIVVGRRLRIGSPPGEGAWNSDVHGVLERDASPAVRALVATLPYGPRERPWSARLVADAICQHFSLRNAEGLRHWFTVGL